LLEDICESMGSEYRDKKLVHLFNVFILNFLWSSYSTIEGGFVCTDDEELYELLVLYEVMVGLENQV